MTRLNSKSKIGWSLKTQQIGGPIRDCNSYAVVICRADIFGRAAEIGFPGLTVGSKPHDLGRAILRIWNPKVDKDRKVQGVHKSRVATLLKHPKRTEFAVHETKLQLHEPRDLSWKWGKNGRGLWALEKTSERQVYRWYPSGGQLFEIFQVPPHILTLKLRWRRLNPDRVLAKLKELAGSLEDLIDHRR